jgi:hypothetical protein
METSFNTRAATLGDPLEIEFDQVEPSAPDFDGDAVSGLQRSSASGNPRPDDGTVSASIYEMPGLEVDATVAHTIEKPVGSEPSVMGAEGQVALSTGIFRVSNFATLSADDFAYGGQLQVGGDQLQAYAGANSSITFATGEVARPTLFAGLNINTKNGTAFNAEVGRSTDTESLLFSSSLSEEIEFGEAEGTCEMTAQGTIAKAGEAPPDLEVGVSCEFKF